MKTTSTTPNFISAKLSFTIVFILFLFKISFAHPTTYASIGDFVWVDTNGNGIQDSGEPGVANVTVKLINASGGVVATTTTNSSGKYSFTNVYVPSCAYFRVQFGTPGQFTWTTKLAPGSTVSNNSNADVNGLSDAFQVCAGDYNMCLDAGIRQSTSGKATIGDFVWVDKNLNGMQDAGEPGVPNVSVKLLNSAGTVVATTTTNSSGIYMFSNISISACGQYRVQFGTPGQYSWTAKQVAGSTVTNNSNADANGLTDAFSVCPGDYNLCIDAGIIPSGGPLPIIFGQFQGSYLNGIGKLAWSTSFETQQTSFDIERSSEGSNFIKLSTVNTKGLSSGSTYTFNDNFPLSGNNYYRIKINEGNGLFQYSNIVLLNAVIKGNNIKLITANPFTNQIKVNVTAENPTIIKVLFADHVGRILKTMLIQGVKGSNEISINDIGGLTKGIYNLEINTGGQSKSIKLMKD